MMKILNYGDEAKKAGAPSSADIYSIDNSNKSQNELFTNMFLLIMFTLGGTILLFPIVMFISVSTQLGSAQREQRYAALRLIGATRKQVNSVYHYIIGSNLYSTQITPKIHIDQSY